MDDELTTPVPRSVDIDPDLRAYLDDAATAGPAVDTATIEDLRLHFRSIRTPPVSVEVAEVVDTTFPGPDGDVGIRLYRNRVGESAAPVLLWFHGGGWVLGDLDTGDMPCRELCMSTGCTVISVDYRLAPEAPFPAAFDDALAALLYVLNHADELMIDPTRIVVGGDSAGGNLAAAVALAARDRSIDLAGQLLVYPVTASNFDPSAPCDLGDGYGLTMAGMGWFWDCYAPDRANRADWRAAPSAGEVAGVADALVITAGYDPLAAEGLSYAEQMRAAGVEVSAEHAPSAIHGVFTMDVTSGAHLRAVAGRWVNSVLSVS